MTDLSTTIAAKSDQLNADDLIAGPRTIRITKVSANQSSAEQPIAIFFEGDGGKPYFPCKSMRRVLVHVWGRDGNAYTGRSLTLYRDPHVKFGGLEVGGIRISHMSHIDGNVTMALTATKGAKKAYMVKPLQDAPAQVTDKQRTGTDTMIARVKDAKTEEALFAITNDPKVKSWRDGLAQKRPELEAEISAAVGEAYQRLVTPPVDDGAPYDQEAA